MRKILHVDMNAFYVSVERAENPKYIGQPIAVAGSEDTRSGIILTASYELRKYGIKAGMSNREAIKLYPNIILIQPRHELYKEYSNKIMIILRQFSPQVEQFSIDEAWVDVTGCDRNYKCLEDLAYTIKEKIKKELKITASVGISYCKVLAKIASDYKKPDAITKIMKEDIQTILWELPAKDLFGVGKKTEEKFLKINIQTIGDLANSDKDFIKSTFGKSGETLWNYSNGIDDSEVKYESGLPKSIGNSSTSKVDIYSFEKANKLLLYLSENVGRKLRGLNLKGNVITITIKTNNFALITRQHKLNQYINLTNIIYIESINLLKLNWDEKVPIRLLGVTVSGIIEDDMQIINENKTQKEEKLEKCLDKIMNKYGDNIITRATLLKK